MENQTNKISTRKARLAKAMGWQLLELSPDMGIHPGYASSSQLPEYNNDSEGQFAKHELLKWLSENIFWGEHRQGDYRWIDFFIHLRRILKITTCDAPNIIIYKVLLVTPAEIAEAADQMLNESGYYKECGIPEISQEEQTN